MEDTPYRRRHLKVPTRNMKRSEREKLHALRPPIRALFYTQEVVAAGCMLVIIALAVFASTLSRAALLLIATLVAASSGVTIVLSQRDFIRTRLQSRADTQADAPLRRP